MDRTQEFLDRMEELGRGFAERAEEHDREDRFVAENFSALRSAKAFSALVPEELGGGGISHRAACLALRRLSRHCTSTALSLSMHQHLIAFQTYNHLHGKPGRKILEAVAAKELILVSTGANDWLGSNGIAEKVEGGFRVTARKAFASGSPMGDILMTSAPYLDPAGGWQVLHFPVPFQAQGLSVKADWKAMGMRGTGSNSISLDRVFVPEESVGFRRPRGTFHPAFMTIATVACPLIVSVYVGAAEAASELARDRVRSRARDPVVPYLMGELENRLVAAQLALDSMIALCDDYSFTPSAETANAVLIRKTLAVNAALEAGEKALEALSGSGYFRDAKVERLLRDLHAGQFHPLPEKRQQLLTGRIALGLEAVEPEPYPESTEAALAAASGRG